MRGECEVQSMSFNGHCLKYEHIICAQVHVRYSLVEEGVQVAGGEGAAMKLLNEVMSNSRPDGTTVVPQRDAVQPANVPQQRESGAGSGGGSEGGYSSAFEDVPEAEEGGAKGEQRKASEGGAAGSSGGGGQASSSVPPPIPAAAPAGSHRTLTFGLIAEGDGDGTAPEPTTAEAAYLAPFGSGGGAAAPVGGSGTAVGGGTAATADEAVIRQPADLQQPQHSTPHHLQQQQRAAARLAAASDPANGPFRRFVLSMELRSFQVSGRKYWGREG